MKDLAVPPAATGASVTAPLPPAPAAPPAAPPPAAPAVAPADTVAASGSAPAPFPVANPATDFVSPTPPTTATPSTYNQPAAGTPEAALLDQMYTVSPQYASAFLALPPDEQRTMAELYNRIPAADRRSFVVTPPAQQRAMAQLYGRMNAEQKQAFVQLPHNQRRSMAQAWEGMGESQRATFMQMSGPEQQGLAQLHEDGNTHTKGMLGGLPPGEMRAMAQMYGRMSPAQKHEFQQLEPHQQRAVAQTCEGMNEPQRAGFLQLSSEDQQAMVEMRGAMSPADRTRFATCSAAQQKQMAQAYRGLTPAQRTAFNAMSLHQRVQFGRVWAEAGRQTVGTDTNRETPAYVRQRLGRLLESGKLTQPGTDPARKTALDHLDELGDVPLEVPPNVQEGDYRQRVFNRVIQHMDDPSSISQGNYNTCGATCAQQSLARSNPSDYAGLVVGLASREGKGRLPAPPPNGTIVTRPPGALQIANTTLPGTAGSQPGNIDNRTEVDRLVQASLMNHASPTGYANAKDTNTLGGIGIASGLPGKSVAKLYEQMRGRPFTPLCSRSPLTILDGGGPTGGTTKTRIMSGIGRQVQAHPGETVPCEIHWNRSGGGGELHWVEVTKTTADRVYYRNPHGNGYYDHGGTNPPTGDIDPANGLHYVEVSDDNGPPRRIYEDGSESVTRTWFENSVEEAIVDPAVAANPMPT